MVASLLGDNVRDFRSRAAAAWCTRGDVVLKASDNDMAITLSFRPGEVTVEEGPRPGTIVLAGEWLRMAELCSGRRSLLGVLRSGDLHVQRGHGLRAAVGAGMALSVPRSFYRQVDRPQQGDSRWRRHPAGAVVTVLALTAVAILRCTGRTRREGRGTAEPSKADGGAVIRTPLGRPAPGDDHIWKRTTSFVVRR
jgi:hypothetical protein